eukprot:UN04267
MMVWYMGKFVCILCLAMIYQITVCYCCCLYMCFYFNFFLLYIISIFSCFNQPIIITIPIQHNNEAVKVLYFSYILPSSTRTLTHTIHTIFLIIICSV